MYSQTHSFVFADALSLTQRMRFLEGVFAIPEQIGARANDVYWFTHDADGRVSFVSNTPTVTQSISIHLRQAEAAGTITRLDAETQSVPSLVFWSIAALSRGIAKKLEYTRPRRR